MVIKIFILFKKKKNIIKEDTRDTFALGLGLIYITATQQQQILLGN